MRPRSRSRSRAWQARCAAAVALATAVLGTTACGPSEGGHTLRLSGEALGTVWKVAIVTREAAARERIADLERRVTVTLDRVDVGMSTWREDAELVRFNRAPGLEPFRFSAEPRRVVAAALELARETGGAFDPTVAPLVALWGFGAEASQEEPSAAALARARERVGWEKLEWREDGRLARRTRGVSLDLSAIAKGYAVDAVLEELVRDRPLGLLVEVGGEVRALGAKPGGAPWRVGIDHPAAPGLQLESVVRLTGGALATSGDYRQTRVVAGERRSHVVDPRSGLPVRTGVASASVLAPSCMEADAVATALMVLGPEEGLAWIEARPWLEALLSIREGERIVARRASSGWARRAGAGPERARELDAGIPR